MLGIPNIDVSIFSDKSNSFKYGNDAGRPESDDMSFCAKCNVVKLGKV